MADTQAIANALKTALQHKATAITATTPAAIALAAADHPGPVAAIVFTRTPAQSQAADLINYELPVNTKIFLNAITKLATTFTLNKPNVSILLTELGDKQTVHCGPPPSRLALGPYQQLLEWQPQ
jgi:hypothetical protein